MIKQEEGLLESTFSKYSSSVEMKPIPSPKGLPVVGTMLSILAAGGAEKLHLYVDKRHRELGPIYREKIGPVTGVFVADANYMRKIFGAEGKYPKHIVPESWLYYNKMYGCKRGLLFMDDEEWLKYRKIMNNIMLKVREDEFYNAAAITADNLTEDWKRGGRIENLEKRLYRWSLEVIVAVLLGPDSYINNKQDLSELINKLSKTVLQIFKESATLSLIPVKFAVKLNLPAWKRFVVAATTAVGEGKTMMERILEIQKQSPSKENFLSEMLNTGIPIEDLKRIVTDLILAAADTTAHTMQWFLHLLSTDISTQNLIYKQITELPYEKRHQSSLIKGALKETLRLYPVAPFLTRYLPENLMVDDYQIKANELILMSLYSSGRNEKYFSNPDSFLPERWLRNGKLYQGVTNPNASLPFAIGSRSCIGKKIAETQIQVTVSKVLQSFMINSDRTQKISIKLHLISVPAEPVQLILEPRKNHKL